MEVQDQERGIQKFLLGPPPPVPVFSDDQIQFLAPLLAEGLRAAAPDQRIGYRVQTTHKGSIPRIFRPRKPPPVPSMPMAGSCT